MKNIFTKNTKKTLIALVFLGLSFVANAQNVNIPDANFKAALVGNAAINTNSDTEIQVSEAIAFTGNIDVSSLGISDMTGLEALTGLTGLQCSSNPITTLNVSTNVNLTFLYCSSTNITSLDVSSNLSLVDLYCATNNIANLDLSANTLLTDLGCGQTPLTTLDLTNNPLINYLYASFSQLSSIDFASGTLIETLIADNNNLTSLVVNGTSLTGVICAGNNITALDFSNHPGLTQLNCSGNLLTQLNIQNGNNTILTSLNATNNLFLTCVQVDDTAFMNTNWAAGIDVGASYSTNCGCTVNIPDANFKAALIANPLINTNADGEIQCAEAIAYTDTIDVNSSGITDLTGIEAFLNITILICKLNNLTSLNIGNNTALTYLDCFANQLTALDLSANTSLIYIDCQNNQITALDLSAHTALVTLYCDNNQIANINLSSCTSLQFLYCSNNLLINIDVSSNTSLFYFYCFYNLLTALDVSANTSLAYFRCPFNQITDLDLSSNNNLIYLWCHNNQLVSLNIQNGNNANLTTLNITNNPNLTCVQVDDVSFMNTNWATAIDATASYSLNCNPCAALPTPQFTVNTNNITTAPATAIFTNNTPNLGLYDFLWHFGDGSAINDDNATVNYTYNTNGNFEISLTLNDPVTGCTITNYDPANSAQTIVCNVPTGNICGFTPLINPNGVINACQGSTVELSLTAGSYPAGSAIQWNKDGVTMIGENYNNHYVNEDGYYTVTVFSPTGCPVVSNPVQVQFNLPANNAPTITATGTSGPCGQINLTLTANGSFGSYLWNNGQTGASLNITAAGNYSVTGQSGVGCNVTSAPFAVSTSTFATPEICMIDVDSINNHPVIIWEKPMLTGILGFGIYKETALYSENYQQIAVVPYDSLSEFMDLNSDGSIISERYRISIIDSCNGGETSLSAPARAMGLKVIPGIGFQRVLTWNYYVSSAQNFTEYKIYSGANFNQLSLLATVPASINSNYIDANPVNGVNTVYKIYADMLIPCESTRALRNRSRSNGTGNIAPLYTNLNEQLNEAESSLDVKIIPNPNNGIFNLSFNNEVSKTSRTLQVFDLLGKVVYETKLENNTNVSLNLTHLESGIYSIRISGNQQQANQRLLITK